MECRNSNVRNHESTKKRTFDSSDFGTFEIGAFGYRWFGPKPNDFGSNCPRIQTKSFSLGLKTPNQTFCRTTKCFVSAFGLQRFKSIQTKLFGFRTVSKYWTIWNWAKSRSSKIRECSDFGRWLYRWVESGFQHYIPMTKNWTHKPKHHLRKKITLKWQNGLG